MEKMYLYNLNNGKSENINNINIGSNDNERKIDENRCMHAITTIVVLITIMRQKNIKSGGIGHVLNNSDSSNWHQCMSIILILGYCYLSLIRMITLKQHWNN